MKIAKIVGWSLVLAGLLVVVALWLYPFSPHNTAFHIQHCVPIREALRHHSSSYPMGADLCHLRALTRVKAGVLGGGLIGLAGFVVLFYVWCYHRAERGAETSGHEDS